MEIKRSGSRPSRKGPAENFTGSVRIDPLFEPPDPARVFGTLVTFEPRARTAWHTHPLGQTLIVTAGCGWTQCWDGRKEEIRPGDVIWSSRHQALARRNRDHRDVAYRHRGKASRQGRRLDGKGQRRTIPGGIKRPVKSERKAR
jgi:quercetin dioxygenase-like cupin family protein